MTVHTVLLKVIRADLHVWTSQTFLHGLLWYLAYVGSPHFCHLMDLLVAVGCIANDAKRHFEIRFEWSGHVG